MRTDSIYFKIYCSNLSSLRSYNYPLTCKNSESVHFYFFFATIYLYPTSST